MARFLTRRWLLWHAALLAACAACGFLSWWQIGRAVGGNVLSWAYAFEWPLFGLCAIALWIREVRVELRTARPAGGAEAEKAEPPTEPPMTSPFPSGVTHAATADAGDEDGELAAYNDYLAWANANPDRRPADYPGRQTA